MFFYYDGVTRGINVVIKWDMAEDPLFKDNLNGFYEGSKVYDKHKYDALVSIREPINSDSFLFYRS